MPNSPIDPANEARNILLQVVTAARGGTPQSMSLAAQITNDYESEHHTILPLFISSVALIETILSSVADEIGISSDKLFSGICLGISIRQMADEQNQQEKEE